MGPLGPAGPGPWCPVPLFATPSVTPGPPRTGGRSAVFSLDKQALLTKRDRLTSQRDGADRRGPGLCRHGQRRRGWFGRLVPQRRHLPGAPFHVGGQPAIALPDVRHRTRERRERASHLLAGPPRPLPALPCVHLAPVPDR